MPGSGWLVRDGCLWGKEHYDQGQEWKTVLLSFILVNIASYTFIIYYAVRYSNGTWKFTGIFFWLNSPISELPAIPEYLFNHLLPPPGMQLKWQNHSGASFQVLLYSSDYISLPFQYRGMEDFPKPPLWVVCSDKGSGLTWEVSVVYSVVSWEKSVRDFLHMTISLCHLRNKKLLGSKRCFQG